MTKKTITIRLPQVDVDRDGSGENGVFEIAQYRLQQSIRTGFIVGSGNSTIRQTITDKVASATVGGVSSYRDFHLNEGTGERVIEVNFTARDGHKTPQWGDPNEPQGSIANATGQGALERMQVLEHYLSAVTEDSRNPITLEFGGYAPGELFDSTADLNEDGLKVVAESPEFNFSPADEGNSVFSGQLRFIETVSSDEILSAAERIARDAT